LTIADDCHTLPVVPKEQVQIRMDARMKKRVNRYMEKLKEDRNSDEISMSAALRSLLNLALDSVGIR
jgi:hypothetical protein